MADKSPQDKSIRETDELARFRDAWKAEVQQRKAQQAEPTQIAPASPVLQSTGASHFVERRPPRKGEIPEDGPAPSFGGFTPLGYAPAPKTAQTRNETTIRLTENTEFTNNQKAAIAAYGRATGAEQAGELDEALRLYRQAFRMNDDVDKLWRRAEAQAYVTQKAAPATTGVEETTKKITKMQLSNDYTVHPHDTHASLVNNAHHTSTITGILEHVLGTFPPSLMFESEDERSDVPLNMLPEELLVHILAEMDHTTIERFAAACRKARVVSLDSTIWKRLVYAIYKPPQIPQEDSVDTLFERYTDYRKLYMEHPRLRLDGVYIAICHYIRSGAGENAWVSVSHLITYHRYLRFFPNGQVVSLLANEGTDPQEIIPRLKPDLVMKGASIGEWNIESSTPTGSGHGADALVQVQNLADSSGVSAHAARYVFQMTLALRSRPVGRWNKLDFVRYESVSLGTGEAIPFSLKHERPFWFSKVRSYGSGLG